MHGVVDCKTISAVSDDGETVLFDLVIRAADIDRDISLLWSPDLDDMLTGGLLVADLSRAAIIDALLHVIGYPLGLEKQDSDNIEGARAIESLDAVIPDSEKPAAFMRRQSPNLIAIQE